MPGSCTSENPTARSACKRGRQLIVHQHRKPHILPILSRMVHASQNGLLTALSCSTNSFVTAASGSSSARYGSGTCCWSKESKVQSFNAPSCHESRRRCSRRAAPLGMLLDRSRRAFYSMDRQMLACRALGRSSIESVHTVVCQPPALHVLLATVHCKSSCYALWRQHQLSPHKKSKSDAIK